MISHWPALHKWNFQYLERLCGYRKIPIELGKRYTDADWTQKIMSISQFLQHANTSSEYYLAQHDLLQQVPRLKDDIDEPEDIHFSQSASAGTVQRAVWIGPSGTHSPCHTDPQPNLYCQVAGSKLFQFEKTYCYVREGEVVFIPAGHKHEVRSLSASFGVNFWF